ncbi:MAG: ECF transporter S component [Defluviitaleaceae bacterium]|nr:ECF transporter S component [Defluviitaleaceae bacterium]
MKTSINTSINTHKLVLLGVLTAIVLVLQVMAVTLRPAFPIFTITTVLIPITIGAALCGVYAGAWLGLVFGFAVLISGDAAPFMSVTVLGTILTVLAKGALAGLAAALVYKLVAKKNKIVAAIAAAIVCPVVNTGVFVIGAYLFFMPTLAEWAASDSSFANAAEYLFIGMIGFNFLIEMGINISFCPVITRLIEHGQRSRGA